MYFFDLVIFANAIFIALERNDAEVLFLVLFNIEQDATERTLRRRGCETN